MVEKYLVPLRELLPADLPNRDRCAELAARHLALIEEANRQFNLTRIVEPREAVVKHVVDSVMPWRWFAGSEEVGDAGAGAGFPGIPLAAALPDTRFVLMESTQKKARFVASAIAALELANAAIEPVRAEDWLREHRMALVTGRAVAPVVRVVDLFADAIARGTRVLLYKGPDAEAQIAEATPALRKRGFAARIIGRYELPEAMGSRTLVEIARG